MNGSRTASDRVQEAAARPPLARSTETPGGTPNEVKGVTMRSGNWRGVIRALALACLLFAGLTTSARAGIGPWHTIPRETPAVDFRTGDIMRAPPVPYGMYAKDYAGTVHGAAGLATGAVHGALGHLKGAAHGLGHG